MTTDHTNAASGIQKEPFLLGRWHHGDGFVVCGTLRVLWADFDTTPSAEFQQRFLAWLCETMNASLNAWTRRASPFPAPDVEALRDEGKRLQDAFGEAIVHSAFDVNGENLAALAQAGTALATFIDQLAALASQRGKGGEKS